MNYGLLNKNIEKMIKNHRLIESEKNIFGSKKTGKIIDLVDLMIGANKSIPKNIPGDSCGRKRDQWKLIECEGHDKKRQKMFIGTNTILPTKTLEEFFCKLSNYDNNMMINGCVYQLILNRLGEKVFNNLFGYVMTKFIISSSIQQPYRSNLKYTSGNPLYSLYDCIELDKLQTGDLIYVSLNPSNVNNENEQGIYVICVNDDEKNNDITKMKFIAYDPVVFSSGAITHLQLQQYLNRKNISTSNHKCDTKKDLSSFTTDELMRLSDKEIIGLLDKWIGKETNREIDKTFGEKTTENCCLTKNDPVRYNYALRVNLNTIDELPENLFENAQSTAWLNLTIEETDHPIYNHGSSRYPKPNGELRGISSIPMENIDSVLSTFETNTDVQKNMYIACKKFADVIIAREYLDEVSICLILAGDVGIGKTHLAVSVAHEITKKGLSAVFIDAHTICRVFEKHLSFTSLLDGLLQDIDLVILDNINERDGIEQETYKHIVDYISDHGKALMITTNNIESLDLDYLMKYYPDFSDECAYDYVVMDKLSGDSYRRAKSVTISDATHGIGENDDYTLCENINSNHNTLVIVDPNLHEFNRREKLSIVENLTLGNFSQDNMVFTTNDNICDMFMYESDDNRHGYGVVIACVYDQMGAEQFANLLPIAHNQFSRLIILIDNVKHFKQLIAKELKNHIDRKRYDNMLERYNIMFGPAFSID
jgi:DNA replication protein DnaC